MSDMVSKATRNERRKIVAALFNGLAGAVIIVGFLQPVFNVNVGAFDWLHASGALLFGALLHALAQGELRNMED